MSILDIFLSLFFFFNDTATTEIYTLSLHDALPIYDIHSIAVVGEQPTLHFHLYGQPLETLRDRKSTRLNSSHGYISYAVFCLKKKKQLSTSYTSVNALTSG